jgi:hypothetical protein
MAKVWFSRRQIEWGRCSSDRTEELAHPLRDVEKPLKRAPLSEQDRGIRWAPKIFTMLVIMAIVTTMMTGPLLQFFGFGRAGSVTARRAHAAS